MWDVVSLSLCCFGMYLQLWAMRVSPKAAKCVHIFWFVDFALTHCAVSLYGVLPHSKAVHNRISTGRHWKSSASSIHKINIGNIAVPAYHSVCVKCNSFLILTMYSPNPALSANPASVVVAVAVAAVHGSQGSHGDTCNGVVQAWVGNFVTPLKRK